MRFALAAVALAGAVQAGDYPVYPTSSEAPIYPTSTESPVYPVYPTSTESPIYPTYPASTSLSAPESVYPTYYPSSENPYETTPCSESLSAPWTTSIVYATSSYVLSGPASYSTIYETYAVSTTVCPVESESPIYPTYVNSSGPYVYPTESAGPYASAEATYPTCGYSVKTISTSCTTVVPTVYYETVSVPCETYAAAPTYGYNYTSPVTAGAGNLAVSGLLAAAAGLAALALA
jgi:hypothetical protein